MKKLIFFELLMLFVFATTAFIVETVHGQEIRIVTEDLPPFQISEENKKVGGLSTEIVEAIFKEAGEVPKIKIYPWVRAYKMALNEENVLIYSIVRSKEREPLFKWLGEIIELRYYFFGLKSRKDIQIQTIEEIKKFETAVSRASFEHKELEKRGFNKVHIVTRQSQLVEMLYAHRMDFVFSSEAPIRAMVENSKHDYSQLKKFYEVKDLKLKLYLAFSLKTSDAVVSRYRKAYESVKNKNIDRVIKDRWLGKGEEETNK